MLLHGSNSTEVYKGQRPSWDTIRARVGLSEEQVKDLSPDNLAAMKWAGNLLQPKADLLSRYLPPYFEFFVNNS